MQYQNNIPIFAKYVVINLLSLHPNIMKINLMDYDCSINIANWTENDLRDFIENNSSLFFAFAYRYIKQQDEVEDLIQESYLKLWRDRKKIGNITSPINYIFTMIKNGALNTIEHNRRISIGIEHDVRDNTDFYNTIIEVESSQIIAETIRTLSPQSQEVLNLVVDGKSLDEIAYILNLSINSVKTVKYRAITKLSKILPKKILIIFV